MNNLKPYTIETTLLVIAFLLLAFVFFHYIWPAMNGEIDDNPKAKKHPKKDIKKPENKTLDFLLMPDELPNLEDRIVFDEHETAISN